MGSEPIKLKLSIIFKIRDQRYSIADPSFFSILLDDELKVPSITISNIENDKDFYLKKLYEDFVKFSFDFPQKTLADCRFIDYNICELTYICNLLYMKGFNKKGKVLSLKELQERNIDLEEYYGTTFSKFGSGF